MYAVFEGGVQGPLLVSILEITRKDEMRIVFLGMIEYSLQIFTLVKNNCIQRCLFFSCHESSLFGVYLGVGTNREEKSIT